MMFTDHEVYYINNEQDAGRFFAAEKSNCEKIPADDLLVS